MTHTTPGATPAPYRPDTTLTLSEIADLTGRDLKTIKNWNSDWQHTGEGRWATRSPAMRCTCLAPHLCEVGPRSTRVRPLLRGLVSNPATGR